MDKHSLTFKVSANEQVKCEFKTMRDELKSVNRISLTQFTEFASSKDETFNTPKAFDHIRNVYYGRVADLRLNRLISEYKQTLNQ